jgi:hypothetical protein
MEEQRMIHIYFMHFITNWGQMARRRKMGDIENNVVKR